MKLKMFGEEISFKEINEYTYMFIKNIERYRFQQKLDTLPLSKVAPIVEKIVKSFNSETDFANKTSEMRKAYSNKNTFYQCVDYDKYAISFKTGEVLTIKTGNIRKPVLKGGELFITLHQEKPKKVNLANLVINKKKVFFI